MKHFIDKRKGFGKNEELLRICTLSLFVVVTCRVFFLLLVGRFQGLFSFLFFTSARINKGTEIRSSKKQNYKAEDKKKLRPKARKHPTEYPSTRSPSRSSFLTNPLSSSSYVASSNLSLRTLFPPSLLSKSFFCVLWFFSLSSRSSSSVFLNCHSHRRCCLPLISVAQAGAAGWRWVRR